MNRTDIKTVLERKLEKDETLLWSGRSRGIWFNRWWLLIFVAHWFVFYFLFVLLERSGNIPVFEGGSFYIFTLVIILYSIVLLRRAISPQFEIYGVSSKRVIIIRRLLFSTTQSFEIEGTVNAKEANWAGRNSVLVYNQKTHRHQLRFSYSFDGIMLTGLDNPSEFIDRLYDAQGMSCD